MASPRDITLLGVASPNVIKVGILLEELGLDYRLRYVDVFKGAQFDPEFLALNPIGKVPVLLDSALGQPIAESGAILIWLAEQAGRFLPAAGPERYEVLHWLMVQMANVGPMLGQFTHFRLVPQGSEPYAYGRYRALAQKIYGWIDARLADRDYIAGGAYSIADMAMLPWAEYVERHEFGYAPYPNMARWREELAARPAVVRAKERIYREYAEASAGTIQSATAADLDRFFGRTDEVPEKDYSAVKTMR